MAEASGPPAESDAASEWEALARDDEGENAPEVESPSISADWPDEAALQDETERPLSIPDAEDHQEAGSTKRRGAKLAGMARGVNPVSLPTACAAMGALILALLIWRADVVRLLPQTALFYKMVGLEVNLRGLAFKDIKITNDTIDGKPVLVIEGMIVGQTRKPVELPRLRFSVRDAQGAEIYAWNAILDQTVLNPGEHAFFKSRLASPPPEGRNIDIRFFTKQDLTGGHA
jgi:hypothetical protein